MQVHEENGGIKKHLTFMQLNLGVLSFCLDNDKADKLTKMDHRAKNSNSWELNCGPHWGIHRRTGDFTSQWTTSHSLSQSWTIDSILL